MTRISVPLVSFQANRADIVTLDAGDVYSAVKQFGLVAVAKEIYSEGSMATARQCGVVLKSQSRMDIDSSLLIQKSSLS